MRDLPRLKIRPVRDPYIAHAAQIEYPRDPFSVLRRDQFIRERKAHHLFESESAGGRVNSLRREKGCAARGEQYGGDGDDRAGYSTETLVSLHESLRFV